MARSADTDPPFNRQECSRNTEIQKYSRNTVENSEGGEETASQIPRFPVSTLVQPPPAGVRRSGGEGCSLHQTVSTVQSAKCALKCHSVDETVCGVRCLQGSSVLEPERRRESREPCVTPGGPEMEPIGRFMISTKFQPFQILQKFLTDLRSWRECAKFLSQNLPE